MNALELTEELKTRTDLSDRDATGIVRVITRAVDDARSGLATRDHFDAQNLLMREHFDSQISNLRSETKADIAGLRAEMHQTIRAQTVWIISSMLAVGGLLIAGIKLIP